MTKLQKLRLASLLILGFFVASVGFHYWQAAYEGQGYPHATYLYQPSDCGVPIEGSKSLVSQISGRHCFGDWFITWAQNVDLDPYRPTLPFVSNYFPFAHTAMLPFTFSSYPLSITLFLAFLVGSSLVFSWYYFRDRRTDAFENTQLVLIFGLLNYPMQMAFDRGNVEILVFLFVWGGLAQYRRRSHLSAFFFAGAAAMKGFPGIYFGLFLADRNYRALFYALLWCAVLTVASMCLLKGGFSVNLGYMKQSAQRYASAVGTDSDVFLQHTSSWLGMIRGLGIWAPSLFTKVPGLEWVRANYAIVRGLLLLAFIVPLLGIRRLQTWQVTSALTFALVMILPAPFDYRLIFVLIPFALFINSTEHRRSDVWYTSLFSLLLVPKQFFMLNDYIGFGTVLNPLVMLTMTAMILVDLVRSRKVRIPTLPSMPSAVMETAR
ncbi:MAG TPA: glycosyltransferase 87 family protein [Polyangiaceae bacterium]